MVETAALWPGPTAFYGVIGLEDLFREVRADGRDWYYLDNAYFDKARQVYFRASKNALQWRGAEPDWKRFADLKLGIQPWRRDGRHIVVVEQSDWFMRAVAGWDWGVNAWTKHILHRLRAHTDRPIVVRHWNRDKAQRGRDLAADLREAWALVTHSSAAANEALVAGVPVFCTGPCVAMVMGSSELENIERPRRPDGRVEWAAMLAGAQWTEEELRSGMAWRALNDRSMA